MAYAGFRGDATVLTKPTEADLRDAAAKKPAAVTIFEYPFESLEPLAILASVEVLKIQDSGALRSLNGASSLSGVKKLVLTTPHTWDSTNRKIEVTSLRPLTSMKALERLILQGVRPADLDLSPVMKMTHLKEVDVGGIPEWMMEHYAKLAAALPNAEGRCLQPYVLIPNLAFCKKCKAQQVILNGAPPKARKWLCPTCNEKKLAEHVAAWDAAKQAR